MLCYNVCSHVDSEVIIFLQLDFFGSLLMLSQHTFQLQMSAYKFTSPYQLDTKQKADKIRDDLLNTVKNLARKEVYLLLPALVISTKLATCWYFGRDQNRA